MRRNATDRESMATFSRERYTLARPFLTLLAKTKRSLTTKQYRELKTKALRGDIEGAAREHEAIMYGKND